MIKCIIFNILIALTVYINTQYIYTGYCCDCKKNNKGSLSNSNKNLGIKINNINPYKNNKPITKTSFPLNTDKTNLSKEGKSNNTDSDKKKLHPILKPQNNDKNDSTKKIKKENEVKKIKDESKKKKEVKTNVKKNEIKNINKVENKEEKENVIKIEINKNSLKISNSKIGEKHFDIEEKDGIVNENFRNTTTLYEINDYIYNMLLKEDIEVKLTGNNLSDKHILFAVVYHISGEGYSYYIGYCEDGNSKKIEDKNNKYNGLFENSQFGNHFIIISSGENLNNCCNMFYGQGEKVYYITFLKNFNTKNVTDMNSMFCGCENLEEIKFPNNFNTKNVTNMSGMFCGCKRLFNLDLSNFNTEKVTDMSSMFCGCSKFSNSTIPNFNTKNVTDMSYMFYHCYNLRNLDLSNFKTENVTNMRYMFYECENLQDLNLSSFNTKNVINMEYMFYCCYGLINLDLSSFNTEKVTDINSMFVSCINLKEVKINNKLIIKGKINKEFYDFDCSFLKNNKIFEFDYL